MKMVQTGQRPSKFQKTTPTHPKLSAYGSSPLPGDGLEERRKKKGRRKRRALLAIWRNKAPPHSPYVSSVMEGVPRSTLPSPPAIFQSPPHIPPESCAHDSGKAGLTHPPTGPGDLPLRSLPGQPGNRKQMLGRVGRGRSRARRAGRPRPGATSGARRRARSAHRPPALRLAGAARTSLKLGGYSSRWERAAGAPGRCVRFGE